MSNDPANLKIELGGIWYGPIAQRTGANTEATWLMLRHCFGLGYRRVEWKCDSLNARSRSTALRMGFRFEGIQEQHRITKGRNRDTAWFRIVADEWPAVDLHLRRLLARPRRRREYPDGLNSGVRRGHPTGYDPPRTAVRAVEHRRHGCRCGHTGGTAG